MASQGYGKATRKANTSRHATPYDRPKKKQLFEENGHDGSFIQNTFSALTSFASSYFTFRPKAALEKMEDSDSSSSEDEAPMSPVKHSLPQKPSPFQLGQGGHAKLDLVSLIEGQKSISPEEYERLSKLLKDKVSDKKSIKGSSPPQQPKEQPERQIEATTNHVVAPPVSVPPPSVLVSPPQSTQSAVKPVPVHAKGQTPIDVVGSFLGRGRGREASTPKPKEQTNGTFYSSTPMLNGSSSFIPARRNALKRPLSPPTNGAIAPFKQVAQTSTVEQEEPVYLDRQPPFKLQRRAPLAASETAKRILQALDQMSSPLADRNPRLSSVLRDTRLTSERARPTDKLTPRRVEKPAPRFVKPPVHPSSPDREGLTMMDVPPTESIDVPLVRKEKKAAQVPITNGTPAKEEPKTPTHSYVMKREKRERETVYKRPGLDSVDIEEEEGEDLKLVAAKKYQQVAPLPTGFSWSLDRPSTASTFEKAEPTALAPEKEEVEPEKPSRLKLSDNFPLTPNNTPSNSFAEPLPHVPMFVEPADKRDKAPSTDFSATNGSKLETFPFGKVEEKTTTFMFTEEKPFVAEKIPKETSPKEDKTIKTPQLPFASSNTFGFLSTPATSDVAPKVDEKSSPKAEEKDAKTEEKSIFKTEEKSVFAPVPEEKPKTEEKISTIFGSAPVPATSIFGSTAAPFGGFVFGNEKKPEEKPKSPTPEEKQEPKEAPKIEEPPKIVAFAPMFPLVPAKPAEPEKKEPETPAKAETPKEEKPLWTAPVEPVAAPKEATVTPTTFGTSASTFVFGATTTAPASTAFSGTQTASMSEVNDSSMEQEHDDKPAPFGQTTTLAPSTSGFSFGSSVPQFANTTTPFTFGAASSGTAEATSSMFGSSSTKSDTGFSTVTPSFGSSFGTSSAFGQSAPAFGSSTSSFGSSSSAFGSSSSAFGSTASAFGSSSSAFGSSSSAFGSSAPAFGQSAPAFGQSAPAFGSSVSAFGSSAPAFGQSAPAFGSTASAFGSSTAFGQSAPAFGQSASAFGSTTSAFGQSSSSFGQTTFGQAGSAPAFGSSGSGFSFNQTQSTPSFSTTPAPFNFGNPTTETASSMAADNFVFTAQTQQQQQAPFGFTQSAQTQSNGQSTPFGSQGGFGNFGSAGVSTFASTPSFSSAGAPSFPGAPFPGFTGDNANSGMFNVGAGTEGRKLVKGRRSKKK